MTWGITPTAEQLDEVLNQAQQLLANQQWGSAEEATHFVLHYRPEDKRAKFLLATALMMERNLDASEELFRETMDVDEFRYSATFNLGNVYSDRGERDKAIEYYRKALEMKPGSQMIRYVIAREQNENGEHDAAREAFTTIANEKPDDQFDFPGQAKEELEKMGAGA